MFRIPYFYPRPTPGIQLVNFGQGGPQSHMDLQPTHTRFWPTVFNVNAYGLGAMPRQVIGPTLPVINNQYSNPLVINNLEIAGIFKNPIAR